MMDLEQLQTVRDRERQSDTLQQLRASFYDEAGELIAELRAERNRVAEETEDPFADPTVRRLSNDIATAEHTIEAIYDRRVGKIVKAASFAAAGQSTPDTDGMTAEEADLFETIVADITANRTRVLEGVEEAPPPDGSGEPPTQGVDAAAAMGGEELEPDPPVAGPDADESEETESAGGTDGEEVERTRVRITEDVGEIFGVDERSYDLATDDVVTLPLANAEPLIERDAAERVE